MEACGTWHSEMFERCSMHRSILAGCIFNALNIAARKKEKQVKIQPWLQYGNRVIEANG